MNKGNNNTSLYSIHPYISAPQRVIVVDGRIQESFPYIYTQYILGFLGANQNAKSDGHYMQMYYIQGL